MILTKRCALITLLLGCIGLTTAIAYPEYDEDSSNAQAENVQNSDNDEIYNPALLQQEVEANERKLAAFSNMDMEMEVKTEVTLKNVRNISDNQLSNEYVSIENEDEHNVSVAEEMEEDDNNTSTQIAEQNVKTLSNEEYETEMPLTKKTRMGRRFNTTTTTIPQYIRKVDDEDKHSLVDKDINVSNSDYVEDELMDHVHQKHTTKIPISKNLENSSEENDDIVPLAIKYYDEIPPENASSSRHVEEVSSEDYYEEEYHDPEHTTTTTTTVQTQDNSILRSFFGGLATTIATTTTTAPTLTLTPLTTTLASIHPIIGQFDSSLFTTSAPLPPPPQSQTQAMLEITTTSHIASAAAAAAAAAATNDKKGKQIPIVSAVPVATTTTATSSRRRLLPHEQLRNFIEDAYIRMPLAVIVDPSAESLEKTKTLWNDAMRTNLNIKIVLVTLNESGKCSSLFRKCFFFF